MVLPPPVPSVGLVVLFSVTVILATLETLALVVGSVYEYVTLYVPGVEVSTVPSTVTSSIVNAVPVELMPPVKLSAGVHVESWAIVESCVVSVG